MRHCTTMLASCLVLLPALGAGCSRKRSRRNEGAETATALAGEVKVRKRGQVVTLNLVLKDANGRTISGLRLPNGKRPREPKVDILDADRNRVYSCTLKYG